MAKYDGLIIPRSYNDYINKSDPIGVLQALALNGVMDAAPTENSEKPAKSGGIYAALAGKQPALTFDDVPTDGSNNPVKSNGIYDALAEKQNTLTFDNTPTENSDNPVKSGGIFAANAVITSDNATLTGVAISAGSVVRVLFTADLTGSDATTGLTLTYNGTAYAVKVGKNGALANFNAYEVESGVFKYLQAYTTLELMFDGTQFIIIGNPVVLSNADYTIYPDGSTKYTSNVIDNLRPRKIYEQKASSFEVDIGTIELILLDWRGFAGYYWLGLIFSYQSTINIFPISTNTSSTPISNDAHIVNVGYEGIQPMVTRYKMNNISFY